MRLKILVTGGAGYIGSHTCKALASRLRAGRARQSERRPPLGGEMGTADRGRYRRSGPRNENAQTLQCSGRHSLCRSRLRRRVIQHPRKYFDNNVSKTLALLDALLDAGVDKVVFSSSCATYGIPRGLPIAEDHPQNPINPYGASKLFVENILNWYERAYGLRYTNLRYFNAAGADPDGEIGEDHTPETHLIPLVIAAAQGRNSAIEIFGTDYDTADGTPVRDYVHVCDLATAHVKALDRLSPEGQAPASI